MHAGPAETNHIIITNSRQQMAGECQPATEEQRRVKQAIGVLQCVLRAILTYLSIISGEKHQIFKEQNVFILELIISLFTKTR